MKRLFLSICLIHICLGFAPRLTPRTYSKRVTKISELRAFDLSRTLDGILKPGKKGWEGEGSSSADDVVRSYFDAWNERDMDRAADLFSDDCEVRVGRGEVFNVPPPHFYL